MIIELGMTQSVINLSTAVGFFTWGPLSDRYGGKPFNVLASACGAIVAHALIISRSPIFLYIFASFIEFSARWLQVNLDMVALLHVA